MSSWHKKQSLLVNFILGCEIITRCKIPMTYVLDMVSGTLLGNPLAFLLSGMVLGILCGYGGCEYGESESVISLEASQQEFFLLLPVHCLWQARSLPFHFCVFETAFGRKKKKDESFW